MKCVQITTINVCHTLLNASRIVIHSSAFDDPATMLYTQTRVWTRVCNRIMHRYTPYPYTVQLHQHRIWSNAMARDFFFIFFHSLSTEKNGVILFCLAALLRRQRQTHAVRNNKRDDYDIIWNIPWVGGSIVCANTFFYLLFLLFSCETPVLLLPASHITTAIRWHSFHSFVPLHHTSKQRSSVESEQWWLINRRYADDSLLFQARKHVIGAMHTKWTGRRRRQTLKWSRKSSFAIHFIRFCFRNRSTHIKVSHFGRIANCI